MRKRICIVTPGYIASTPRVVREADALALAGFDVRVVFSQGQLEQIREHDQELLATKSWRHDSFRWSSRRKDERWAHLHSGIRHRLAQVMPSTAWGITGIAERAEGRVYPELADIASAEPADLYIGHYPAGLAAAARAARHHDAMLGYDVEDLYAETFPNTPEWATARGRIIRLERRYVSKCAHISAVSQPVAEVFARTYKGVQPTVVHNCHPWGDRLTLDGLRKDRRGPQLSLYWYSQVVGLDRGIQTAIRAAGLLSEPPQIHLRGALASTVREPLEQLAKECRVADGLYFHNSCPPDELLSRAVEHDVGLALEVADSLNKQLTASNKIFLYMTAGLAIAATDVAGQQAVMMASPESGRLHPVGDYRALASHLREWQSDGRLLERAKEASLEAAQGRWNAEREGAAIAAAIERLFQSSRTEPRVAYA